MLILALAIALASNTSGQGWDWRYPNQERKILKDLNNDLYILANTSTGFEISKLNPQGQLMWTRQAAGDARIKAYKTDLFNNLVIVGNTSSLVTINNWTVQPNGQRSFFILKLSPAAAVLSLNVYGSNTDTYVNDLFITPQGDYLLGGGFRGRFDVNGHLVTGDTLNRFFMLKANSSQQVMWSEVSGFASPVGEAWIDELVETSSGAIYFAFTCYGLLSYKGYDFGNSGQFLVRLDASRNLTWERYLTYPAESFTTYSDPQTSADTVFMKMYFSHHGSNSFIYRWTPDGGSRAVVVGNHHMAYAIDNNLIYYAGAGIDQPWTTQFHYRKIGRLSTALKPVGQADSVVTDYAAFHEMQVLSSGVLYISGYGDGLPGNYVGKFTLSGTTGAESTREQGIAIFPNPCVGQFTLPTGTDVGETAVYNINGESVPYKKYGNRIELASSEAGIYFVRFTVKGKEVWTKLVVQ